MTNLLSQRNPVLSVHPIIALGIAENFPSEGTTVQDLANKLHLSEDIVGRLLSHSATYHIYYESSPGYFVHTAASRALSDNGGMRQYYMVGCEETLPATLKVKLKFLIPYPPKCPNTLHAPPRQHPPWFKTRCPKSLNLV